MKIEITIGTNNIDREHLLELLSDGVIESKNPDTLSNEDLILDYVWSILGSNMEFDRTGLEIIEIKE